MEQDQRLNAETQFDSASSSPFNPYEVLTNSEHSWAAVEQVL
jgi:hypothetical protein